MKYTKAMINHNLTLHCGYKLVLAICVGTQNSEELFQLLTFTKALGGQMENNEKL